MTQETQEAPAPINSVVRLSKLGSDALTVDFTAGMTVGEYLERADLTVDPDQMITVNGEPAEVDDIVEPETVVVVAGKIRNG